MASLNRIILIGRITTDPDVKVTTEGKAIAKFSLAVDRTFAEDKTDVFNIVCWEKLSEQVDQSFKLGMQVLVEGRIQSNSYKDKDDETIYTTDINASYLRIMDNKAVAVVAKKPKAAAVEVDDELPAALAETEDDIPF